jgi:probable F420-dependent oxidoreductase
MRVDTYAPLSSWSAAQAYARSIEELGFTNLCTPEIHGDSFIPLAVAAMATERIGLRTAITVAFPRSPMVVANTAWSLQVNSGGRFTLGLGTQVKGHNERRFSVKWVAPRTRLREYIESLRAIWRCWELGEKLDYRGEHYNFTLMTPEFSPPKSNLPPIPVYTAAVRPRMMRLSGEVADGVRLHGFATRRYLEEVALTEITAGLESRGRARETFEICGGGFIATGKTPEQVAKRREWVRYRVSFYGSTRTYKPVMSLHGWDDLADELHGMSVTGKWKEMAARIPDDVLDAFCASGTYDQIGAAIEERFGGISDCVDLGFPGDEGELDPELSDVLADIRKLDSPYTGQAQTYES